MEKVKLHLIPLVTLPLIFSRDLLNCHLYLLHFPFVVFFFFYFNFLSGYTHLAVLLIKYKCQAASFRDFITRSRSGKKNKQTRMIYQQAILFFCGFSFFTRRKRYPKNYSRKSNVTRRIKSIRVSVQ